MEHSKKIRIALIIAFFSATVAALATAVVFAVRSDTLCVPLFVIFAVLLASGIGYALSHRKTPGFLFDLELAFELIVIIFVLIIALPIALILWIAESIAEAVRVRNSEKEPKAFNDSRP